MQKLKLSEKAHCFSPERTNSQANASTEQHILCCIIESNLGLVDPVRKQIQEARI